MTTILDFDKNDKLKKYVWTSNWIKQFDFEGCEFGMGEKPIFEYRKTLSIRRKPKKDNLVYIVIEDIEHEKSEFNYPAGREFETEQQAINFWLSEKAELEFFEQKNKENIVFDGRRYFWKIDEQENIKEKIIC